MPIDRHCCATCRHIALWTADAPTVTFRCGRLGWETRPVWRFACWQERPPGVPMRRSGDGPAEAEENTGAPVHE